MSPLPSAAVFGLAIQVVDREGERFLVRATLRAPGLAASVGTVLVAGEIRDLLTQVERQYGDFAAPVKWENQASPSLRLSWRLDRHGHLEGRLEVRDRAEGWAAMARVRADQSYLPRVALGLRLLLR